MPFMSFPEYRPDVDDFRGAHTQALSGVLPRGDGYGPVPGLQAYTAALPAACRGLFYARQTDGTITVFAGTETKLYTLNNSTLAWADSGATYSAIPSTDQWGFAQFGNAVVAVQANADPQAIDLANLAAGFSALGGSPPRARYITVVGRFLVLSGLTSNPRRVHWSDLDAITTWSAGTGYANAIDLPDGGVVRGVAGGEFGLILQESTARRMVYVPGQKPAFQIERVTEEKGLLGPYSIVRAGERILFVSPQGFQEFLAGVLAPIGKERVDRTVLADLDTANLRLLIGASDPAGTRAFWAYKSVGHSTGTTFDRLLCYDVVLKRFSPPIAVEGEYLAPIVKPGLTLDALDSVSGSVDALGFTLDSVQAALSARLAAVDTSHQLGFFDGANLEATLETPEQDISGRRMLVRGFEVRCDAATIYGSVKHRANAQSSLATSAETLIDSQGFCPQRIDTKLARARVRIPAGTAWTYAMGVEPDIVATGRR